LSEQACVDNAPVTRPSQPASSTELAIRLGLLLIIIAAVLARFFRLGSRELWLDEAYSVFLADMPFRHMLHFAIGDVHPPLFYLFLWTWVRLAGDSEAVLRLFSVLIFSAGAIGFFFVARKWLEKSPAAFATALFVLSPILFTYSLEVRMYMLLVCAVVALLAVHCLVTKDNNPTWLLLVLYSFTAALVYYIHYVALFVLAGFFLDWLFVTRLRPDRLLRLGFAAVLTLLWIAPWMPVMFHQSAQRELEAQALATSYEDPAALTFHEAPGKPAFRKQLAAKVYDGAQVMGVYLTRKPVVLLSLPMAVAFLAVLYLGLAGDRFCRLFLVLSGCLFAGIVFLGLDQPRYFLPLLPLLFLAVARAAQVCERSRWPLLTKIVALLVLLTYAIGFSGQVTIVHPRPWSRLVASLSRDYRPHDIVIFDVLYGQVIFDYYARQAAFHPAELGFPEPIYAWWGRQPFTGWAGPTVHKSDLESFSTVVETRPQPGTVWLVLYELRYYDPHDSLRLELSRKGHARELDYAGSNRDPEGRELPRLFAIR
jgi:4-amino-4-deoxy-L-arabinose transferase-like glycosyltransferase